jgi:GT2 family glycosyltransferase
MTDGPVMLGYIHGGNVRAEFMASVLNALSGPDRTEMIAGVVDASVGPLIAMARNMLVRRFLDSTLDWLWIVDSDIQFGPRTIERMLEAADPDKIPVISALYWVLVGGEQRPAAYTAAPREDGELHFSHLTAWEPGEVVEVDGTGAGCLLMHRRVLEQVCDGDEGRAWWFRELTVGARELGEDFSFCVRLARHSIPLHLHTGVEVGHVKSVLLGKPSP